MDIPFWPNQNRSNLVQFKKGRRCRKNRSPLIFRQEQRELLKEQLKPKSPTQWPNFLMNPLTHLVKLCTWGVLGVAFISQTTLLVAHSIVLLAAFGLLGVRGLFALLSSGKVSKGHWDALWHGESVLLILFMAGFLLDIKLCILPDLFGHQLVKKNSKVYL